MAKRDKKLVLKAVKRRFRSAYRTSTCEYTGQVTVYCRNPEGSFGLTKITLNYETLKELEKELDSNTPVR